MAGVTKDQLKKQISEILKNADLTVISAKKVRQQLEEKLGCDLLSRKKEIDALVMEYVSKNEKNKAASDKDDDDDDDDEDSESEKSSEESEDEKPKEKRAAPTRKAPVKRGKKNSTDEEESEGSDDNASDEEYSPKKTNAAAKSKKGGKKKQDSDSDSDETWKKPPPVKKAKKTTATGAKGKGTGFTRPYTLSPELATLMGAESLPRHEVVKKMWSIIKERNLYDPKNKQYAICDKDLIKVMGVKRFRTFGMLKYLRTHFID